MPIQPPASTRVQSTPPDFRIYIRARFSDTGRIGVEVLCGASRIEMAFWNELLPVDETDREIMEMVIVQLLSRGVSTGRIKSTVGRLAVYGLARHIRYSMESNAELHDFGGLPVVAELPRKRAQLAGITAIALT